MNPSPGNVISFSRKTEASKARVAELAKAGIAKMQEVERAAREQTEADANQSRALAELETAIRKTYALFGGAGKNWIDSVHSNVAVMQVFALPATGDADASRRKAAHGRELVTNGLAMIRDSEGPGRAVWFLEETLAAVRRW